MTTHPRETFKQAGYKYVFQHKDMHHVLYNLATKNFERWNASPNFAGYALRYKNTLLEFASSYNESEKSQLIHSMRKIQRFGEQHPASNSTMINIYRNYIAK